MMLQMDRLIVEGIPPFGGRCVFDVDSNSNTHHGWYGKTLLARLFRLLSVYTRTTFPQWLELAGVSFREASLSHMNPYLLSVFHEMETGKEVEFGVKFGLGKNGEVEYIKEDVWYGDEGELFLQKGEGRKVSVKDKESRLTLEVLSSPASSALSALASFDGINPVLRELVQALRSIRVVHQGDLNDADWFGSKMRAVYEMSYSDLQKIERYVFSHQREDLVTRIVLSQEDPGLVFYNWDDVPMPAAHVPSSIYAMVLLASEASRLPEGGLLVSDDILPWASEDVYRDLKSLFPGSGRILALL